LNPTWERAVRRGDAQAVRELLQAGTDVDARDRHGQTALMLAAHRGYGEITALLVEAGADLNVAAKYNLTALMLAIVAGHAPVARLLIRAGANLDVRGTGAPGFAGKTAHDLAIAREMTELYPDLARG
jgi:ankyrin repeat protein